MATNSLHNDTFFKPIHLFLFHLPRLPPFLCLRGVTSIHPTKPEQNLSVTCLPSSKHQIHHIMAVLLFNYLSTPTPHHILTSLKVIFLRHKSGHFAPHSNISMAHCSLQNKGQASLLVLVTSLFTQTLCVSF